MYPFLELFVEVEGKSEKEKMGSGNGVRSD